MKGTVLGDREQGVGIRDKGKRKTENGKRQTENGKGKREMTKVECDTEDQVLFIYLFNQYPKPKKR